MRRNGMWFSLVALFTLAAGSAVYAETAAESFAQGEKLLIQGDMEGALKAYAEAVQADRSNREYVEHYAMLRRVIQLQASLDQEQDAARWENTARALHAFYVSQKLFPQALKLGRRVHEKLNNEWSASTLAETQLAMDMNDEAVATLTALDGAKTSPATRALLGIALVRSKQIDRAKQIAEQLDAGAGADPQTVYAIARLSAAVGEKSKSLELLAKCLQSVPPSRQNGYIEHARSSPEFASLADTPEFAKALKTESAVPESKCSGGKSCAGCPMRGKCPGSQGK